MNRKSEKQITIKEERMDAQADIAAVVGKIQIALSAYCTLRAHYSYLSDSSL